MLLELKRYPEAGRSYDSYLRKGGEGTAEVYRGRGLTRMKERRFEEAADDYGRALERHPDAEMYLHRGWAHFFADAFKLALRDFGKAVALHPQGCDAYVGRGLAQVMLGRYPEAVADSDRALELDPKSPTMMHNIACILAQAAARVEADALEPARNQRADQYRRRALDAVRRTLDLLRPDERRSFWQDRILPDPALAPVRTLPGFKEVESTYFPSGERSGNTSNPARVSGGPSEGSVP
jgi:tetratricopeptide (TPR) repeat protein